MVMAGPLAERRLFERFINIRRFKACQKR